MWVPLVLPFYGRNENTNRRDLETKQGTVTPVAYISYRNGSAKINKIDRGTLEKDRPRWIVFVAYIVVSYVLSLRGNEGLVLNLGELRNTWQPDRGDYFVIALWGKLKRETAYKNYVIPCINVTKSGIKAKYTVLRLL